MPLMSWHAFPERPVLVSPRSTRDETGILRNEGVASSHMRIYDEEPEKFTAKLGTGGADKHVRQGCGDLGFIATTALKHMSIKGSGAGSGHLEILNALRGGGPGRGSRA